MLLKLQPIIALYEPETNFFYNSNYCVYSIDNAVTGYSLVS